MTNALGEPITAKPSTLPTLVVGIGASAGGVSAIKKFLAKVPTTGDIAFVFLQHLDESGRQLAHEVLSHFTTLPVQEARAGDALRAGVLYHTPPRTLVTVRKGAFVVEAHGEREGRPAVIDLFFRSLAEDLGQRTVGIVLSGDGADGAEGLKTISDAGGMTLAQAPESADFPSMPQQAIARGAVDHILPPDEMPAELAAYAKYLARLFADGGSASVYREITSALGEICEILLKGTRHDFKHYKTSTLVRRIQRRMQVLQLAEVGAYLVKLRAEAKEVDALFKELLINVTSFFRDPEAFETLKSEVLRRALSHRRPEQKYRVWVAGCSSGEEAYTFAILLREVLSELERPPEVQVIATDIDEVALAQARKGIYPLTIAEDVSPERLSKYFVRKGGRYHVTKELREIVLFSAHNLINDPPFSQLDLISCRNLLIYLGSHLQKKLLPVFHYALKPGGALFLGTSESLAGHKELFRTVSARHRIGQRKMTAIRPPGFSASVPQMAFSPSSEHLRDHEADLHLVGQRIILDEFAPKYVIADDEGRIVSVSAGMGVYLDPAAGTFQNKLIKLVKPSLRVGLRLAFAEAKRLKRKVTHEDSTIKLEGVVQRAGITVQPMPQLGDDGGLYMVVFHYLGEIHAVTEKRGSVDHAAIDGAVVEQLERELTAVREELDRSVQDLEASNEELKSSNEELLSMNEELQSANEELEASKEEVQEANEALQRSNTELENLLASTEIATLFLGPSMHIQNYTPALEAVYNVARRDIGRPLAHFTHLAKAMPPYPSPEAVAHQRETLEEDIILLDGRRLLRRISPYRTDEGVHSGIVVTFIDVTHLRAAEDAKWESEHRFEAMADSAPVLVWISGRDQLHRWFNRSWLGFTGRELAQEQGSGWTEGVHPDDLDSCLETYQSSFETRSEFYREYRLRHRSGAYRWVSDNGVPRYTPAGVFDGYIGGCMDIDVQKRVLDDLARSERRLETMFKTSPSFMCQLVGPDFIFENANERYHELVGRRDIIGKRVVDVVPDAEQQGFLALLREVVRTGTSYVGKEVVLRVARPLGRVEEVVIDFVYQSDGAVNDDSGRIFVHGTDVTDKVRDRQAVERAKAVIEHERENFRNLYRQTPEMVCVMSGPEHVFEFVNEAHVKVLGFDATAMTVRQAQPESIQVHGILDKVYATGETARLREIPVTVGDTLRYFNLTYAPRRTPDGSVDGVMILGNEVTEQLLIRESIKGQRQALEATLRGDSTEGVLAILTRMIDHGVQGRAFGAAMLVDADGKGLTPVATPNLPSDYQATVDRLPLPKGAAGSWSTPILSSQGRILGMFALFFRGRRDPTSAEEQLLNLSARTASLIIERQEAMAGLERAQHSAERGRNVAEAASDAKTRFLANMSHEIRTPLGAIVGFANLLSELQVENLEAASFVERIARNAAQLSRLIDDLLDLSKIEVNHLELELGPVDLQEAIDDAFAALSEQAAKKGLGFELSRLTPIPHFVTTDPTRLRQILINLVGNAVKFTERGKVRVELQVLHHGSTRTLEVSVADTGIGLAQAHHGRIFESFIQADSSITRKYGGTGLGLALSRELARLLGGDLRLLSSTPGVGSVFVLSIDLGSEPRAAQTPEVEKPWRNTSLLGKRILIVDDARDNRVLVGRYLRQTEAICEMASDGAEAVAKVHGAPFDMVLMDLQMPVLDGYEAVVKLRSEGFAMPIVALTAHALKEERSRCLKAGFSDYITKPINPRTLLKVIEGLLLGPGY